MADQKRWFKLWCSAPSDDALLTLPPEIRWAWAALGCYTKLHGVKGVVRVGASNGVLAVTMGVPLEKLFETIALLPHIYLSVTPLRRPHGRAREPVSDGPVIVGAQPLDTPGVQMLKDWGSRNGGIIVTWRNWNKYQEDTTLSLRVAALRSKRRGDERRVAVLPPSVSDETEGVSTGQSAPLALNAPTNGPVQFHTPTVILNALRRAPKLGAVPKLTAPEFWQAELRANPGVDYPAEILKAEAWLTSHPERHIKKLTAFLHNWLARVDREEN